MNMSYVLLVDISNVVVISVCEHVKCVASRYIKCSSDKCMGTCQMYR